MKGIRKALTNMEANFIKELDKTYSTSISKTHAIDAFQSARNKLVIELWKHEHRT